MDVKLMLAWLDGIVEQGEGRDFCDLDIHDANMTRAIAACLRSGITVDDPHWYTITDDGKAALEEYQRAHGVKEAGDA